MIDQDKRRAIWCLHNEGMTVRQIARRLRVSRNAVNRIIGDKGRMPEGPRGDKIHVDEQLLCRLYEECDGRIQRMHEKLREEQKLALGYSTLTRLVREHGLSRPPASRCDRVADQPGAEMQHDTTSYLITIAAAPVRVIASLLYLRCSKMRYLKFYRSFNRFRMKCFFHEALGFWGYAARHCIIDNTNLARLRGSGKNALIVAEMESFAAGYGFRFLCHEIGHANRKAGTERAFYTVETNFLPGRSFQSMEDLNRQALEWATVRMAHRAVGKARLIPALAFEEERHSLLKVPPYLPAPYLDHQRSTDQYGYVAVNGNYYWVPGTSQREVHALEYSDCLKIYHHRKLLVQYPLPAEEVKNAILSPAGQPRPRYRPRHRVRPTEEEQKALNAVGPDVQAYLRFLLAQKGIQTHAVIRQVHGLYQNTALPLFVKTIQRALKYRIADGRILERIAALQLREGEYHVPLVEVPRELHTREAYREGCATEEGSYPPPGLIGEEHG